MHTLIRKQRIQIGLEAAWDFFSNPANLSEITPPEMNFRILNENVPKQIYPGLVILYKVSPILKVSVTWLTEITQVSAPNYFIDDQRVGPYKLWHHQHHFRLTDDGVEMTDIVHYKLPFGILGRLANLLFVKKQLRDIFEYRRNILESRFNS